MIFGRALFMTFSPARSLKRYVAYNMAQFYKHIITDNKTGAAGSCFI
jgi:hypothetical protein